MSIININMLDKIEVTWTGKFWNRRAVLTIHQAEVFGATGEPQVIEVQDGDNLTLTGRDGGKLAFVSAGSEA